MNLPLVLVWVLIVLAVARAHWPAPQPVYHHSLPCACFEGRPAHR